MGEKSIHLGRKVPHPPFDLKGSACLLIFDQLVFDVFLQTEGLLRNQLSTRILQIELLQSLTQLHRRIHGHANGESEKIHGHLTRAAGVLQLQRDAVDQILELLGILFLQKSFLVQCADFLQILRQIGQIALKDLFCFRRQLHIVIGSGHLVPHVDGAFGELVVADLLQENAPLPGQQIGSVKNQLIDLEGGN